VKNKLLAAVATLMSATLIGQLVQVAFMPLLTRIYTTHDFGMLALFSSALSVLMVVSSARFELAIPLPFHDRSAIALARLSIVINFMASLLCLLVIGAVSHWVIKEDYGVYFWLLPLALLFAGSYKVFSYWAIRKNDYRRLGLTKLMQGGGTVVGQLFGSMLGAGALGLIIGVVLGYLSAFLSFRPAWLSRKIVKGFKGTGVSRRLIKKHRKLPIYDAPAAFLDSFSSQLPNLLLSILFSPAIGGIYMLADRVISTPVSLFSQSIAQVLLGNVRDAVSNGRLSRVAKQLVIGLASLAFFPTILCFTFAEECFGILFGTEWADSGNYASWLVLGYLGQFIYSPLSVILLSTGGQSINLGIQIISLLLRCAALSIGFFFSDIYLTVKLLSLATFLGYLFGVSAVLKHIKFFEMGAGRST